MEQKENASLAAVGNAEPVASDAATARHTPGPWRREKIALGECIIAARNDEIALVYTNDGLDEPTWFPAEANAHLIAAAPDLFAACKEFVRKCDNGEARSLRSYQQMSEAIAKAEGRSVMNRDGRI